MPPIPSEPFLTASARPSRGRSPTEGISESGGGYALQLSTRAQNILVPPSIQVSYDGDAVRGCDHASRPGSPRIRRRRSGCIPLWVARPIWVARPAKMMIRDGGRRV